MSVAEPPLFSARCAWGFTLVEVLLAISVVAVLASIALPAYADYMYRTQVAQAKADIREIELRIAQYDVTMRSLPESLADVGMNGRLDPWGQPYQFLNLTIPGNLKDARKDRKLHPLNQDFDLYSIGRDQKSQKPLTAKVSQDDIIRANNGAFLGLAVDY